MEARIRDKITRRIQRRRLSLSSDTAQIPYVGDWLSSNMGILVHGDASAATTLHDIANFLLQPSAVGMPATDASIRARMGLLCQNPRASRCVSRRDGENKYFVRDINRAGVHAVAEALDQLLPHTAANALLRGAARRASAAARARPKVIPGNFSPAAHCPCLERQQCQGRHECLWTGIYCQPRDAQAAIGFEGIVPFTGQIFRRPLQGEIQRGTYVPGPGGFHWRRVEQMPLLNLSRLLQALRQNAAAAAAPAGPGGGGDAGAG